MKQNKLLGVWRSMHNRCYNEKQASYKDYGGRGIYVCDRWHGVDGYKNFLNDLGYPIAGQSLERTNNDGPYSPENCRWATRGEQANNKRNSRWITANGKTQTMAQWARDLGCNPSNILYRIKSGMTEEMAVTTPISDRPNSKLTEDDARYVKENYPMLTSTQLAATLKVSKKTVLNIIHGKTFKDVQ